jgi:transposase-like protein
MNLKRGNGAGDPGSGVGNLEQNGRMSMGDGTRPDPEVLEMPKRRRFTGEYKERIVREAESCLEHGQTGALLRREGLFSSQLASWRKQYSNGGRKALCDDKRGRKRKRTPEQDEIESLRKENEKLKHRLFQAETIIDCQKKLSQMLGIDLKTGKDIEVD